MKHVLFEEPNSGILSLLLFLNVFFFFSRLLTESKQAEFIYKVRILMQLEKYDDAVSMKKKNICSL